MFSNRPFTAAAIDAATTAGFDFDVAANAGFDDADVTPLTPPGATAGYAEIDDAVAGEDLSDADATIVVGDGETVLGSVQVTVNGNAPAVVAVKASPDSIATGATTTITVPPGTQSGTRIALDGRGVPRLRSHGRGQLGVTLLVQTPTKLDKEQRELLRQLSELREETTVEGAVQKHNQGFFGRLRDAFAGQ